MRARKLTVTQYGARGESDARKAAAYLVNDS